MIAELFKTGHRNDWYALYKQAYEDGRVFYSLKISTWPLSRTAWMSENVKDIIDALTKEQEQHEEVPKYLDEEGISLWNLVNKHRAEAIKLCQIELGIS